MSFKARPNQGWAVRTAPPDWQDGAWLWWTLHVSRSGAWTHAIDTWAHALKAAGIDPLDRRRAQRWLRHNKGLSIVRAVMQEA